MLPVREADREVSQKVWVVVIRLVAHGASLHNTPPTYTHAGLPWRETIQMLVRLSRFKLLSQQVLESTPEGNMKGNEEIETLTSYGHLFRKK